MAYVGHAQLDARGVYALFEQAISHKLKWPKIRLQTPFGLPVVLARAGERSKYFGQIMVTDGGPFAANRYFGRIDSHGLFHATDSATREVFVVLLKLATSPVETAREYGMLTGNCCFCNLKLTDARSTANGYGPVCAEHYGLQWEREAA
jgi:hypothetical protein